MKVFSKLPPKYVAVDDTWLCEEDDQEYEPNIKDGHWKMKGGVRIRQFPKGTILLKSVDNDSGDITT